MITVLVWSAVDVRWMLDRFGLQLNQSPPGESIPGSYWGDSEAGLIGTSLYVRDDTPLHSLLHETSHYVCMSPRRRESLHTDAGGSDIEEAAVCYLQVILAQAVGIERGAIAVDMDAWGYSFRLGSTLAWFESDAGDAFAWLRRHRLLHADTGPTWRLRA